MAVAARHLIPADEPSPRWSGLDLPGAALATASLGALVFALSQAADAGWSSTQTLVVGGAGLAGLLCFVVVELRTTHPLLRIERLADRGVGGGFAMMLAASTALFGTFLLASLYLQNVLGTGPLETGLAFLPLAVALAIGVHAGSHVLSHAGVRVPMAAGFAVAAAGTAAAVRRRRARQLRQRRPPGDARGRSRARHRARLRLGLRHDRRAGRRDRDALRAQHDGP